MYEPSRNLMSFHIAGFKNYEGAMVLADLKPGMSCSWRLSRIIPSIPRPLL